MSESKKIGEWSSNTNSHVFEVRFFENEEHGLFIAKIEAKLPLLPLSSRRQPGRAPRKIETPETDRIHDKDLDMLTARCRAQITGRYGQIRNLRQKSLWM